MTFNPHKTRYSPANLTDNPLKPELSIKSDVEYIVKLPVFVMVAALVFPLEFGMSGYLIYHPSRAVTKFDTAVVYHDHIGGNQDPYVWNMQFLHTYCHITQMSPNVGDINFWISGDSFP